MVRYPGFVGGPSLHIVRSKEIWYTPYMTTSITMTSKGQLTLPAAIRKQLKLQAGDTLDVKFDPEQRQINLSKPMTLEEVRAMNQAIMKRNKISFKDYKSGDGFRYHVKKKYGL